MDIELGPPSTGPICDFCSDKHIFARYPTKDFIALHESLGSRGDWAACKTCSELIEAQKWDALLERSIDTFIEKYGPVVPRVVLRRSVIELHEGFRKNRAMIH